MQDPTRPLWKTSRCLSIHPVHSTTDSLTGKNAMHWHMQHGVVPSACSAVTHGSAPLLCLYEVFMHNYDDHCMGKSMRMCSRMFNTKKLVDSSYIEINTHARERQIHNRNFTTIFLVWTLCKNYCIIIRAHLRGEGSQYACVQISSRLQLRLKAEIDNWETQK